MTPERFERLRQALLRRQHDLTVLADGVHKDHNVSAIIRSCDATGIARLHMVSEDGELKRHHMIAGGAKRWVGVSLHANTDNAYQALRDKGMQILAAHGAPEAADFRDIDFTKPTAIVMGSELEGPTQYAIEHADTAISIPMYGLVESLNVSVAAAVILFEAARQREAAGFYSRPAPDAEAFRTTLFEWAYPRIAKRCRILGRSYPPLSKDGRMLRNPFQD